MGKGEIAKVFETLAKDAMKAGKDTVDKLETFTRDTAKRIEQNVDDAVRADEQAARRIEAAGKKAEPGDPAGGVRKDSRGRVIPPGVQRLPSGKLPPNFSFAGKVFKGDDLPPDLAAKYPNGVRFTEDGYPDFSPYAIKSVTFDPHFNGDRSTDFTAANRMAGLRHTPDDYTWHHHQDAQTMQLIPSDIHDAVKHAGGVAIMKGRK